MNLLRKVEMMHDDNIESVVLILYSNSFDDDSLQCWLELLMIHSLEQVGRPYRRAHCEPGWKVSFL